MKTRLLLTCFLAISFTFHAFALRIESGNDIRITEPVHEDLYVFGNAIYIDAPVYGDIWCAGGTITVNDTIHGDLVVAGGNIYLRGAVLDDVRAAGGTLMISGTIAGDLLIAGGTVTVEPSANIGGDVAMSGGTVTIGSVVQGYVKATGGKVYLNGMIGKALEFNGGELTLNGVIAGPSNIAANKLIVGERAALRGNVRYWTGEGEVDFGKALQNGALLSYDPSLREHYERPDYKFLGFASFLAVLWYLIACFILIWLGQWLFQTVFQKAAGTVQVEPLRSLGYGFVYFAAAPVGIVLLFITIVGIPVGFLALLFYGMFFALANIITVLLGAHWINTRKNYHWRPIQIVGVALGLLILLKVVSSIPFLGWLVQIVVVLIAFGAILVNTKILTRKPANIQPL